MTITAPRDGATTILPDVSDARPPGAGGRLSDEPRGTPALTAFAAALVRRCRDAWNAVAFVSVEAETFMVAEVRELAPGPRFAKAWHRFWSYALDLGLTLWVARVPVAGILFGFAIYCLTPQAQDLFLGLPGYWPKIRLYLVLLIVWALPTCYATWILLNTDERYTRWPKERPRFRKWLLAWTPPILGTFVFLDVAAGVYRSYQNLPGSGDQIYADATRMLNWMWACLAVSAALFWGLYIYFRRRGSHKVIRFAERCSGWIVEWPRRHSFPVFGLREDAHGRREIESDLGLVLLVLITVIFVVGPIFKPLWFAEAFPLAAAVPVVIGGWIPWLCFLSGLGRRLHFPVLTVKVAILVLVPLTFWPHYVVPLNAKAPPGAAGLDLKQAVTLWKRANCVGDDLKQCPRPIIVAAAGGASRAGFFTASAIGAMLDGIPGEHPTKPAGKQLFALSTVSGSSVAGVMAVAAMASSSDGMQPCDPKAPAFWDDGGTPTQRNPITSWRSCLEALVTGDFLTPVFTGLIFHDSLRIACAPWLLHYLSFLCPDDRGALLERSFENHFRALIKPDQDAGAANPVRKSGLTSSFLALRPIEGHWLPLLILNSTSVNRGRRIITTILNARYQNSGCPNVSERKSKSCTLFSDSARFHDLLGAGERSDITLSAAAHNSARFPFVSPPAQLPGPPGRSDSDRVVDGGYFENFGAQTANELAEAIGRVDPSLRPFVLVLSNNPEAAEDPEPAAETEAQIAAADGEAEAGPPNVDDTHVQELEESGFLSDVFGPVNTVLRTRDARGALAILNLRIALAQIKPYCSSVARLRVWSPSNETSGAPAISMSWWLSRPMQHYLRNETGLTPDEREPRNEHDVQALMTALRDPCPADATR